MSLVEKARKKKEKFKGGAREVFKLDLNIALIAFASTVVSMLMLWINNPAAYTLQSFGYTIFLNFNNVVLAKLAKSFKTRLDEKERELALQREALEARMKEELERAKRAAGI